MARAVILYENRGETATLSGGAYEAALPQSNLQSSDLGEVAQTTDDANASTKIIADLGENFPVGGVVVGPGNFTPGSLARLTLANDAGFTDIVYQTGWIDFPGTVVDSLDLPWEHPDFWFGVLSYSILAELPVYFVHVVPYEFEVIGARYVKIEFDDTANVDGYHRYGYLGIYRAFRPTYNYDEDNSSGILDLVDVSESLGGQRSFYERGIRRIWRAAFKWLPESQLFRSFFRMSVKHRTSRPVFIVPDPDDTEFLQQRCYPATFKQIPAIQQLLVDRGATAVELEEHL